MKTANDVATAFVDFVLRYLDHGRWNEIKTLPAVDVRILFELVVVAGFEPREIKLGKLVGHFQDENDTNIDETFAVNVLCPFKVVGKDSYNHYSATGWLDCAFRRVVYGATKKKENREKIIEVMVLEIERSIPLSPIRLSQRDFLSECPPKILTGGFEYFVDHTKDSHEINNSCAGIHDRCNGRMDLNRVTEKAWPREEADKIVCRKCRLQIPIPLGIRTYGDLRQRLIFE